MALTIYPPILASSQPAFANLSDAYTINFTLPSSVSVASVGHMQVRIVFVKNNKSAVNTTVYPDGIIYTKNFSIGDYTTAGSVKITTDDLSGGWIQGAYYKVQLRFGIASTLWDKKGGTLPFYQWKATEVANNNFSEWSTVMIIKPISMPSIAIINNSINQNGLGISTTTTTSTETSSNPLFVGSYYCDDSSQEALSKYRFILYDASGNPIEGADSGWLQNNAYNNQNTYDYLDLLKKYLADGGTITDNIGRALSQEDGYVSCVNSYRFKYLLAEDITYTVKFFIETENGYTNSDNPATYTFIVNKQELARLDNIELKVVDGSLSYSSSTDLENSAKCKEEGCIKVYLNSDALITGNYVISRVCEKDNYAIAQEMKYFACSAQQFSNYLLYTDYTVESGVKYKYFLQQENANGLRSPALYETNAPARYVDFEYSYLFTDGIQLKLKYNNTVQSFKHTQLATKQDTIGGKYPTIFKNGYAYYAEFPITGLITLNLDENENFFQYGLNGLYYKDELVIPSDKYKVTVPAAGYNRYDHEGNLAPEIFDREDYPIIEGQQALIKNTFNTNLTDNNIFIERKFREKVEEFLSGYDYKLFKSPTEGNIVVTLMNVSLTPNQQLGRMIYSFSATAYEVLENTVANLNDYGIITIGQYENAYADNTEQLAVGQLSGLFTGRNKRKGWDEGSTSEAVDLLALIKEDNHSEQVILGTSLENYYSSLNSIWIEQYPKIDLDQDIRNYDVEIAELNSKTILTDEEKARLIELESLKAELENLKAYNAQEVANPIISLIMTDSSGKEKEISLGVNRIFTFRDIDIQSMYLKYTGTIVINYTCFIKTRENTKNTDLSITTSYVWDQVYGIFTTTEDILNSYDFYRNYMVDTYGNIIALLPEEDWSKEVDRGYDYMAGLYQSLDILDVIKERTKSLIEIVYSVTLDEYDKSTGEWHNNRLYCKFDDISAIEIEADEGTCLMVGKMVDGSTAMKKVFIGPTEKYVVNPSDELITSLKFANPTFAIINFKVKTTQKVKGGSE